MAKEKTFADKAKEIRKRYEGRENDPTSKRTMQKQIQLLMEENERVKADKERTDNELFEDAMRYGGKIKFANGGRMVVDKSIREDMVQSARDRSMGLVSYGKELERVSKERGGEYYEGGGTLKDRYRLGGDMKKREEYQNGGPIPSSMLAQIPGLLDQMQQSSVQKINEEKGIVVNLDSPMDPNINVPPANRTYSSEASANAAQRKYGLPDVPAFESAPVETVENVDPATGLPEQKSLEGGMDPLTGAIASDTPGSVDPRLGAIASSLPYLFDLGVASTPEQTRFDRVDLNEMSLDKQRELTRRNSALARLMTRKNVRQHATSSGQALSNLAAGNAAITEQQIQGDLQSFLAEEQANTNIKNQEQLTNQQISMQEIIANEQNKAVSQGQASKVFHGLSETAQGAIKDANLKAENIRYNQEGVQIINSMFPNYNWGVNPENNQMMIQFALDNINKGQ